AVKLKDGREFKAKVVGTDEKTDIAVIKIDATNLPVAQFANSDDVRVGQFAFAIGAPFKLDYTFTYGIISGKGRSKLLATGGYSISDYLQTDASINPGNSGGPLCDIDGKVVGMNTLINGLNRGLGFAIPSNLTKKIGQSVELTVWRKGQTMKIAVTTGELPNDISRASNELTPPVPTKPEDSNKFGLQVQDLTKEVATRLKLSVTQGVIVTDVADNSLAAAQDIQREDVITEVDGKKITNVASFLDALNKADPRKGILLYLDRKGSKTFAVLKAGG